MKDTDSTVKYYWTGYKDAMAGKPKRKFPINKPSIEWAKRKTAYNAGYSEGKIRVATPF